MKKLIFILTFYLFSQNLTAQTFTVGNTCCNYHLVNLTLGLGSFFEVDIDGDLNNDIHIADYHYTQPGFNGYSEDEVFITSPNNTECVYTTSQTSSCVFASVIDNLPITTSLNSNLNWSLIKLQAPYIYYNYVRPSIGTPTVCGIATDPFYIGFRKVLPSNDTIYGWIHMDSSFPGKVIDYAYTCGSYTAVPPTSTITTLSAAICPGDSIALNANPTGGLFYGLCAYNNYFYANCTNSTGVFTVNYALPNPNGCTTSPSSVTFSVKPMPSVGFTDVYGYLKCLSDTIDLNSIVYPTGGTFSFSAAGLLGDTIYCSQAGLGTHTLSYSYTNTNSCSKTANTLVQIVHCDIGIQESSLKAERFSIYPNPNSGEFEIKGTKEETIFISNELGQLIETKNLTRENNYSVKLRNLQSGIYFVGNKISRQKIVVIK